MLNWRRWLLSLLLALVLERAAWAQAHFRRGDSNADLRIDLSDAIEILGALFVGTAVIQCQDAADVDDSGSLNITDAIYLLDFLFLGDSPPPPPYPNWEGDPTPDNLTCLGPPEDLPGVVRQDLTLSRRNVYRLAAIVTIKEGATLHIEQGTTILGARHGLLVVERGARLEASGTAEAPVVFTSEKPVGTRQRGDWLGVMLLGRGELNLSGDEHFVEGLPALMFGGGTEPMPDDSSGRLTHVRIEFAGGQLGLDIATPGLSLLAAGSGTYIDYVQVKQCRADAISIVGGAADLCHVLLTGNSSDALDFSFGYQGRIQFLLAHQDSTVLEGTADGIESDNGELPLAALDATPLTRPILSNVTLIGPGDPTHDFGGQGLLLRRGTGGLIFNLIVQGFRLAGFDIDDAETTRNIDTGNLIVDYTTFHSNGTGGVEHCQSAGGETGRQQENDPANGFRYTSCEILENLMLHNIFSESPLLVDPYNVTFPDFRPSSEATEDSLSPESIDGRFWPANYRGAVSPNGDNWTEAGWISYWTE